MISSRNNKRALLTGNGINQLDGTQSISWGALLEDLKETYSIKVDLANVFKPFPLGFEEMLHRKPGKNTFDEKLKNLKAKIREQIELQLENKLGYNEYHTKIMKVGYNDIITTNYDYSLEKSVEKDFFYEKDKIALNKQEIKFSLKRCYKINAVDCKVWHIHGELFDSRNIKDYNRYYKEESIMIGYEHYTSYLEKIQENFNGKPGNQKIKNTSLKSRIKHNTTGNFWTDILFTHDVDIIGQGLDFSENHLWWLIDQRANFIKNNNFEKEIKIDNILRYYYPVIGSNEIIDLKDPHEFEKIRKKLNAKDKSKAVSEVLEAFKVVPQPIECSSYQNFYDLLIEIHLKSKNV